jgi:hypothetical protein
MESLHTSPAINANNIKSTATSGLDINLAATVINGSVSGSARSTLTRTGGYDMAFRLFNFRVDNDGAMEMISISDLAPLVADPSTLPAVGDTPSVTTSPTSSKENQKAKISTPSVGSNDFQDPPPSPTTAYCDRCDAWAPETSSPMRSLAVRILEEAP